MSNLFDFTHEGGPAAGQSGRKEAPAQSIESPVRSGGEGAERRPPQYTVFFDFETGGLEDHHPDIQLAAVAVDDETLTEQASFDARIQFLEADAEPEALKINHYDPEVWRRLAQPERQVVERFAAFLRPFCCVQKRSKAGKPYQVAKLAGHNAQTFDGPRLQRMFKRHGQFMPFEFRVADTLQGAMWWFFSRRHVIPPADFRLVTLAEYFGLSAEGAHDALVDVKLSIEIARAIREVK